MGLTRIHPFVLAVAAVAVSILLLSSAAAASTMLRRSSSGQVITLHAADSAVAPPPVQPASVGQVLRTLVLFNNSVKAGSFLPAVAYNPNGVVYDTHDQTAWVSAGNFLGVLDVSGHNGIAYVPAVAPWGIAYDNVSNEVLATDYSALNATVYAGTTYQRIGTISLGSGPIAATYDWQTDEFYISNSHSNNVSVVNAANLHVVASVSVGTTPQGLAYVPVTGEVYVANLQSNNVSVISQSTHAVVATISITSSGPGSVLYDAANKFVYVGGASNVWPVNPVGRAVSPPISMTGQYGLALDPNAGVLYAPNYASGMVNYASTSGGTVLGSVGLGAYSFPNSAAYDPVDNDILIPTNNYYDYLSSNVTVISASSHAVVGAIGLEHLPSAELYDATTQSTYVYDGGTGDVYEISDTTDLVTRTVFVGYTPHGFVPYGGLAMDPSTNALYVDYYNSLVGSVAVVDLASFTVTKVLPAADFYDPTGMVFDSADNRVFVANYLSGNVTVISATTNTAVAWVPVGSHPVGVSYDPANDGVYVANSYTSQVSVLNGASHAVVATVTTGSAPFGTAYDPTNGEIYVSNLNSANLTAISGNTNRTVANITVPLVGSPLFLAYDSVNKSILVDSWGSGSSLGQLGIVDATTQRWVGAVNVGRSPVGIAYDPTQQLAFVANDVPGSISIVRMGNVVAPLVLTKFTATPSSIILGQGTDLVVTTTGGSGSLTYAYSSLPPGCASVNASTLVCTPSAAGTYGIGVNVTDSTGDRVSGAARLTVSSPGALQVTGFTASPSIIRQGQSTSFAVLASGGIPPLTYSYQGLPTGCLSANQSTLACTPIASGAFRVSVLVEDAGAHSATANTSLLVNPPSPLTAATLNATPDRVAINETTVLSAQATGGTFPLTYLYAQLPPGCLSANSSQLSCVPTTAGVYHPRVTISDVAGSVVNATATLTVTQGSGGPGPSGSGGLFGQVWVWVVLVLVVAAAVALFVMLRRRRGSSPGNPGGAEPPQGPGG